MTHAELTATGAANAMVRLVPVCMSARSEAPGRIRVHDPPGTPGPAVRGLHERHRSRASISTKILVQGVSGFRAPLQDAFDKKEMVSRGSFGVIYRVVHKGALCAACV